MAKFQFRPATLLKIRENTRDERRSELADVQRTDAELENRLTRLEKEQEQLRNECRKAVGPGMLDLSRLVESQRYAVTLRDRQMELIEQRRTLAEEIERRRQALIEADREVRMLEKLRENQLQTHQQHEGRQESKRLDEAALQTTAGRGI
jgi:flagellar FliJ protein